MTKAARGARKRFRRENRDEIASENDSTRDLTEFVREYLIPEDQREATSHWHPSRRGFSPHHRS